MPLHDHRSILRTPAGEVEVLRAAARAAEDAGDFAGALRLVRGLPAREFGRQWEAQLRLMAAPIDPGAASLARWLVHPALRWALERPAGSVLLDYAGLVLKSRGLPAADRAEQAATLAAADPLVMDAGLFDGGLFGRYLAEAVSPGLRARCGPVGDWPERPVSVWQCLGEAGGVPVLADLWSGAEISCLPWTVPHALPLRALLYGRLVPVVGRVPLAFALRPIVVDRRCAVRLMRARQRGSEPEERLRAVVRSRIRAELALAAA